MKVFALCAALGLGGAYVWQKQKTAAAHDALRPPEKQQRTVLPGSKSAWGAPPGGKMMDDDGKVVEPPEVSEPGSQDVGGMADEDFGTDGGFVLPDEGGDEPAQEKTVLPGSKSIAPLLERPESKPVEPESPPRPGKVEP